MNLVAKEAAAAIPLPVANLSAQEDAIAQYFKTASDTGFNVVRIFGHGNSTSFELQTGPGDYPPDNCFAWPMFLMTASNAPCHAQVSTTRACSEVLITSWR